MDETISISLPSGSKWCCCGSCCDRIAATNPPSYTCLVVLPEPRSGSAEADPANRADSSRDFCHHMADPGPAASPGVTCAWIRVTIVYRSLCYPSTPSMTTQMLFQQIPENSDKTGVLKWKSRRQKNAKRLMWNLKFAIFLSLFYQTLSRWMWKYKIKSFHSLASGQNALHVAV